MKTDRQIQSALVNLDDSVLVVIDIQDCFLDKYDESITKAVLEKAIWLIELAQQLHVPIVAMAEDLEHSGNLSEKILQALPKDVVVHNKNVFGLGGHPEILDEIKVSGRKTMVLIGMETDVCVTHSALHLMENGYSVVIARDTVATTSEFDQDIGIGRMRDAGAAISSAKGIYYEWLSSVNNLEALLERSPQIHKKSPMIL